VAPTRQRGVLPSVPRPRGMVGVGTMCAALAIMSLVSVPAFADPAPTVLHLDQTAELTVPRDELSVEIRAEATGANPGQVQAEVNRRMAAALAKVKAVAAVKAASGNYQTYQITPTGPDGKPKPPQWHTVQNLALTSRDFTAALDLTGRLQADGLTVSGYAARPAAGLDRRSVERVDRTRQANRRDIASQRGADRKSSCRQHIATGRRAPADDDGTRRGRRRPPTPGRRSRRHHDIRHDRRGHRADAEIVRAQTFTGL